jgi:hypothetical protein
VEAQGRASLRSGVFKKYNKTTEGINHDQPKYQYCSESSFTELEPQQQFPAKESATTLQRQSNRQSCRRCRRLGSLDALERLD